MGSKSTAKSKELMVTSVKTWRPLGKGGTLTDEGPEPEGFKGVTNIL